MCVSSHPAHSGDNCGLEVKRHSRTVWMLKHCVLFFSWRSAGPLVWWCPWMHTWPGCEFLSKQQQEASSGLHWMYLLSWKPSQCWWMSRSTAVILTRIPSRCEIYLRLDSKVWAFFCVELNLFHLILTDQPVMPAVESNSTPVVL